MSSLGFFQQKSIISKNYILILIKQLMNATHCYCTAVNMVENMASRDGGYAHHSRDGLWVIQPSNASQNQITPKSCNNGTCCGSISFHLFQSWYDLLK